MNLWHPYNTVLGKSDRRVCFKKAAFPMKWASSAKCKPPSCHVFLLSHSYLKVLPNPWQMQQNRCCCAGGWVRGRGTSGKLHGMLWSWKTVANFRHKISSELHRKGPKGAENSNWQEADIIDLRVGVSLPSAKQWNVSWKQQSSIAIGLSAIHEEHSVSYSI